jgi:hypothetical protein
MSQESTTHRESPQGLSIQTANEEQLRAALEQAFDYRGDVTIVRTDGTKLEGYVFDRKIGASLADSFVRIIPADRNVKLSIPYSDVAGLSFTGRDAAAGKSWEAWVKKYFDKKAAGEQNIELKPESLD